MRLKDVKKGQEFIEEDQGMCVRLLALEDAREVSGNGAMLVTSNAYDSAGRQVSTVMPDGSSEVYAYDALGSRMAVIRVGAGQALQFDPQDFKLSEVIALDAYAVTETPAWKENGDLGLGANGVPTAWWDCNAAISHLPGQSSVTTSVTRVQLTGLSSACLGRTVSTDINSVTSVTTESADAGNAARTTTRVNLATAETDISVAVAGQEVSRTNSLGAVIAYAFDGYSRQTSVAAVSGSRILQTVTTYHDDGTAASSAEVFGTATNVTTYSARQPLQSPEGAYSVTVTDPAGNATVNFYTSDSGTPYRSEGATYPTATALDADGNIAELQTWRDEAGQPDITRWHYDLAAGLVTNKVYADGHGPAYGYTAEGRLASRVWARGVSATYTYADAEEGRVQTINYSGATPDVTNSYNLAGRLVAVDDGSGHRTLSYDQKGRLTSETNSLAVITRHHDTFGRDAGYDLNLPGFAAGTHSVRYVYGSAGRVDQVISVCNGVTNLFRYSFLEGTSLVSGMTNTLGFGWSRIYEANRNLITSVSNFWNASTLSMFCYSNDIVGRRTQRIDAAQSLSVTNAFAYNHRSEVTNAVMGTSTCGYDYDDIGNRLVSSVNAGSSSYTANNLNQYTAITGASACSPTYDLDGNMTWDGRFTHTWDGENRLIHSTPGGSIATNGAVLVENSYDYQNRRFKKVVKQLSGRGAGYPMDPSQPGSWNTIETRRYIWDGWNIAAEITVDESASTTNVTRYVWGLDLSGAVQGAGGVGGLVAEIRDEGNMYFPCYDANGNITEYVDVYGTVRCHFEYDAFGTTVAMSNDLAHTFRFRFSTKYHDDETGILVYQQRHYISPLARWASRDPIEEVGGFNLGMFANNDGVNKADSLGLIVIYIGGAAELNTTETWGNVRKSLLERFAAVTRANSFAPWDSQASVAAGLHARIHDNPCEPITLVGHSYGGDTALKVAALLLQTDPSYKCLSIVTLDPVSQFNVQTWGGIGRPENVKEWINVYQRATLTDLVVSVPILGWGIGGVIAGVGSLTRNADGVATGGGQWNYVPAATYNVPTIAGIGHMDVDLMLDLKLPGLGTTVRRRISELQSSGCR